MTFTTTDLMKLFDMGRSSILMALYDGDLVGHKEKIEGQKAYWVIEEESVIEIAKKRKRWRRRLEETCCDREYAKLRNYILSKAKEAD